MSSAIEVLKEILKLNLAIKKGSNYGTLTEKQQKAIGEALLALEQKENLIKHCDELEANNSNEICKTMFGALIGTCKVKEILGIKEGVENE